MAEYRKKLYCDCDFLLKLRKSAGHIPYYCTNAIEIWLNVRKLILKSGVYLNINRAKFARHTKSRKDRDLFVQLWKKCANGEHTLRFYGEEHKNADAVSLLRSCEGMAYAYLLGGDADEAIGISRNYGVVTLTPNVWQKDEPAQKTLYLFQGCSTTVKKDQHIGWNEILRADESRLSNCNSMIIVDNYILKNNEIIENNLYPLLQELLPPQLRNEEDFHISIVTAKVNESQKFNKMYDAIKKEIAKIRPLLKVKFDLYVTSKDNFHDRYLITNNAYINCGGGFDLLGKCKKVGKDTKIQITWQGIHNCAEGGDDDCCNIVQNVDKITKKIKNKTGGDFWPKDELEWFENRLFAEFASND